MTMTYYEIKKVFSKRGSKIALGIIGIVMAIVLYFIIGENGYLNQNGDEEIGFAAISKMKEQKKEWAGVLNEEVIRKVIEENNRISQTQEAKSNDFQQNDIAYSQKQGFMDIRNLLNYAYADFNEYDYYRADSLSPDESINFYPNRIKNLKEWLKGDGKDQFSEKEKNYLISKYEELETPFYYDYQAGWKSLFQYAPSIIMILTLVLGFLCAGIFSGEFHQKATAIFYSSYYGRNRAIWAKVKAGLILITGIYWSVIAIYSALVLGILGTDGASCQIQCSTNGWKSMYNITNIQEYLLIVLCGYLGCMFMLLLTMLVSAKTNSSVTAVIIPFGLIFLPSFLSGISLPWLNKLLGLLPDQMMQINLVVKYFNTYEIFGTIYSAVPILILLYTVLSVLLIPFIYKIYQRKEVC